MARPSGGDPIEAGRGGNKGFGRVEGLVFGDDRRSRLLSISLGVAILALLTAYSLMTVGQRPWDVDDLLSDPSSYEGKRIFMSHTIQGFDLGDPVMVYFERDGREVALPFSFEEPPNLVVGRVVNIKATSLLESEGYIRVVEYHVASYAPKVMFGLVGMVLILFYFLASYRFAPRALLWERRTDA